MVECRRILIPDGMGSGREATLTGRAAYRFDEILAGMKYCAPMFGVGPKSIFDSTDPMNWSVSQLAYTEARMLQRFRVPVIYKDIVPVSYEAPPWAETVEAEEFDETGMGQITAPNSTDMPFADAQFNRRLIEVKGGKIGYHYDVHELEVSQQLKKPISDLRMRAAVKGFERHMNLIALAGDAAQKIVGFWNNTKITPVAATTGNWDNPATSPLAILADVNQGIQAVYQNSGTNAVVTDICMPIEALNALATTILAATSGGVTAPVAMSILAFLKQNNFSKLQKNVDIVFHGIPADPDNLMSTLNTAGTLKHNGNAIVPGTPSSRVVFYAKDEEYLVMHQPLTLQFLAPQPRGTDVVVPGRYRFTPIDIRYPKTVYFLDNVLKADPQS
jgi:hypothetical protein